jgi:endonuclease III
MITPIQSSAKWKDILKARKDHLTGLIKIVDIKTGKVSNVQTLTVNLIKNEMSYIEDQLKGRK